MSEPAKQGVQPSKPTTKPDGPAPEPPPGRNPMPDPTFEPVGYRYRHEDRESWSFAPPEDADSMEILADEGWQVERLYRRVEGEDAAS